ncbi:transcription termination/antitermination protein NusG [Pseudovibrio sp. SCP19]|uniref:transcription termination/antitermination protein NusG n=1 Tax=Pseudovibrio sp. SCP19 TaxID=3141374 RepID=UPI00333D3A27
MIATVENDPNHWFLVQLKPNGFDMALRNLLRQGIACFMPLQRGGTSHASRGKTTGLRPLFSGYLFVNFDPLSGKWQSVNNTKGVTRLVGFGNGLPSPIPAALIEGLQTRCDSKGELLPIDDLVIGEKVRIVAGPFANYIVEVEKLPDTTRVGVLFEMLGRTARATVPVRDLIRCGSRAA